MINLFDRPNRLLKLAMIGAALLLVLLVVLSVLVWHIPWFAPSWYLAPAPQQISMLRWNEQGIPLTVPVTYETMPTSLSDITFDGNQLWVTGSTDANERGAIFSVDPRTLKTTNQVDVEPNPRGILFDGKHIWVANQGSNNVSCIPIESTAASANPQVGSPVTRNPPGQGASPYFLVFDGKYVWVTAYGEGQNALWRLSAKDCSEDPEDPDITIEALESVLNEPFGIIFDGTYIWVANQGSNEVMRLDPANCAETVCTPKRIPIGDKESHPSNLAYDGTYVWATLKGKGAAVARIHAQTGTVLGKLVIGQPIKVDDQPDVKEELDGIAFDGKYIWTVSSTGWVYQLRAIDTTPENKFCARGTGKCNSDQTYSASRITFDSTFVWIIITDGTSNLIRR